MAVGVGDLQAIGGAFTVAQTIHNSGTMSGLAHASAKAKGGDATAVAVGLGAGQAAIGAGSVSQIVQNSGSTIVGSGTAFASDAVVKATGLAALAVGVGVGDLQVAALAGTAYQSVTNGPTATIKGHGKATAIGGGTHNATAVGVGVGEGQACPLRRSVDPDHPQWWSHPGQRDGERKRASKGYGHCECHRIGLRRSADRGRHAGGLRDQPQFRHDQRNGKGYGVRGK